MTIALLGKQDMAAVARILRGANLGKDYTTKADVVMLLHTLSPGVAAGFAESGAFASFANFT